MKSQTKDEASGGFSIHDALYIVFKHKWKILVLTLLGFAVAAVMAYQVMREPTYQSEAKLMIKYMVERPTTDVESDAGLISGGMMLEMELVKNLDTAIEVAREIGPIKLVPGAVVPPKAEDVAGIVLGGLDVYCLPGSTNLLTLTYQNSDPEMTQEVLRQVIQTYYKKHLEVHRSTENIGELSRQTDAARGVLRLTEDEINKLKEKSGVLSISAAKDEFESRKKLTRQNLDEAESLLAEQRAKIKNMEETLATSTKGNGEELADEAAGEASEPNEDADARRKRTLAFAEYGDLAQRVELLQERRNGLLITRKASDPALRSLDDQISRFRTRTLDLLDEYPDLAGKLAAAKPGMQMMGGPVLSLDDEKALEAAYEARLKVIEAQSKELDSEVSRISALEFQLRDLERRRDLEEERFTYFETRLEKAKVDLGLKPTEIPNINEIQSPTPPVKSIDEKAMKLIFGIAFSGLAAGLAIAFLMEMVIDRRVSRPNEIRSRLQLPLMLSIPYINGKGRKANIMGSYPALESPDEVPALTLSKASKGELTVSNERGGDHFIAPYVDAIHDRITFNFQVNNIKHKPKLVALTGLSRGAGTSTIAAGLAKSFADNGSRKVLLVDMNPDPDGARAEQAQSLFKALEFARTDRFRLSSRNLYFANASTRRDSKDSHALAPTAFHEILPSLVSSDFDYVIFDLPPIGPTSPTLTMAGFMDKVLLVLDGDKTTRDNLSWGYTELEKARADVSCIFNKVRSHAPRWVQGEV